MTRGQTAAQDVAAYLRARTPLLWIVSREESRVEALLFEAAASAGYLAHTWDVADGAREIDGRTCDYGTKDPGDMLAMIGIGNRISRDVWIMRDLPAWLAPPMGITVSRQLCNLARKLPTFSREKAQAVIVLSTSASVPDDLAGHATVIEWPMPDREEIAALLDAAVNSLPDEMKASAAPNGTRDAAIDAAVGLIGQEATSCFARSLVQTRRIDPVMIAKEKKRVIARERVLEWYDPLAGGMDAVGGLENLKAWLATRRSAYSAKARAYGLPAPKGALLVGVPGCGKSLTAKAIATAWGVPLLRLDLGALKSKFVGESEGNLRKAFAVIATIGRCVVWLDEIEKALAGSTQGAADGGVSSDALGAILSWMQERQGEAFVIATANDVSSLPPELMRKGRFDEIWFVDLPTVTERIGIIHASLKSHGRTLNESGAAAVAVACTDFTGSEIAALVPDALFQAFADGEREIETKDLLQAARDVVPLSKTAAEKITALRAWAKGRARHATPQTTTDALTPSRKLDL